MWFAPERNVVLSVCVVLSDCDVVLSDRSVVLSEVLSRLCGAERTVVLSEVWSCRTVVCL